MSKQNELHPSRLRVIEIRTPISSLEWNEYYEFRYQVLRKPLGQPPGSEKNEGDAYGLHFALYEDGELMAITRLDEAEPGVSQVRFVAVHPESQGKGFGRMIMEHCENISLMSGNTKMILQARENAVKFYEKLGYSVLEKTYLLFGQVQHYLMEKEYELA